MKHHPPSELITRYLSGDLPEGQAELLMRWIDESKENRTFFEESQALWELSSQYDDQFETDVAKAWTIVEKKINQPEIVATSPRRSLPTSLWRIAAAVALLLVVGFALFQLTTPKVPPPLVFQTAEDQRQQIDLPDGSTVWLNENSRLSYQPPFTLRKVKLEGEAFFEVAEDKAHPFEILAANSKTVVLGTQFNVRAYPDEPEVAVTVKSGQVALRALSEPQEQLILRAGQSGQLSRADEQVSQLPAAQTNADAWKTRRLEFEDVPLRQVLPALERYFDLEIEVSDEKLLNCHLNGTYDKPQIEHIMEVLQFILNVQVEEQQGKYVINGKGCE